MIKKFFTLFLSGLGLILSLCACRTDSFYQHRAADRAREYLLARSPELSAEQVGYVKYTYPVILTSKILSGHSTGVQQIIMMWEIPGQDQLYLVCGNSSARMDYWYPNRLIRKNYVLQDSAYTGCVQSSRTYTITNFYRDLSNKELNFVRFTNPEVRESTLPPESLRDEITPEEAEKAQLSLLWYFPGSDRVLIFTGLVKDPDSLAGWSRKLAALTTRSEIERYLGTVRKAPGDFTSGLRQKEPVEAAVVKELEVSGTAEEATEEAAPAEETKEATESEDAPSQSTEPAANDEVAPTTEAGE